MEPAEPLRLALEIERGREPLSGRLGPVGQTREFVGWTGLAAALTSALEDAGERARRVTTPKPNEAECGGTD